MMKYVILLALVAYAVAQDNRPPHGGDSLHHMIRAEVHEIMQANTGISVGDCATKCDALFDLASGHDEAATDKMCQEECQHQHSMHHGHGGN